MVNSPALISQVNRRQKVIDGDSQFLARALGELFGLHGEDLDEVLRNPGENGSLRRDTKAVEHGMLDRGMPSLSEIFTTVVNEIACRMDGMGRKESDTMDLRSWVQESFTLATANAAFGPKNPFSQDPSLINDFW